MSQNLFDLAALSDDDLVAGFRRTGRSAVYDKAGVGLVLHACTRGIADLKPRADSRRIPNL